MTKRPLLLAALAGLALLAFPAEASPFRLHIRGKAAVSANLTPGANAGGAGWTLISAPSPIGNPADDGYADVAVARLDQEPHRVLRGSETMRLGVKAYHIPTATEYGAGKLSNICEVDFWADNGPMVAVTTETLNPDTGITDFNVPIRRVDYATDGPHEVRWKAVPCTGYPLVGQGDYLVGPIGNFFGSGGGAFSGVTLTATGWGGKQQIKIGDSVIGVGVAPNTFITSNSTTNATACVAATGSNCTGTGDDGTYAVNINQGTIAQEYMELDDAPSFVFYTSATSAIPQRIVYFGTTGNDSTGTGTSASPFRTLQKALAPGFGNQNTEEWYLCAMTGTYPITATGIGGSGPGLGNFLYWAHIQPSSKAPCDGTGSGAVTFDASVGQGNNNDLSIVQTMFDSVAITKSEGIRGDDNFGSGATRTGSLMALKNVNYTGLGLNAIDDGAANATGGIWCLGSTFRLMGNGCNNATTLLIATSTFDYISSDVLSNAFAMIGNTITNHGPFPGFGSVTNGSNSVTGLTFNTNLLAVGQIFGTQPGAAFPGGSCVAPYTYTVASIVSSSSITVSPSAAATENSVAMGAVCVHPDQAQSAFSRFNMIVADNDGSATTNNGGRGLTNDSTQLRWAIMNNRFYENVLAGSRLKVWEWEAPYMESILVAGNVFSGDSFVQPLSTYVRNFNLNNTCDTVQNRPTGITWRGGTC